MFAAKKPLQRVYVLMDVYWGLDSLCSSSMFNAMMFDIDSVAAWLRAKNFEYAAIWVEQNKDEYLQGVFAGFRPHP